MSEVSDLPDNLYVAVSQFQSSSYGVTVSAESVGGSTPGVRVTWNTALPPECVTSVRVDFHIIKTGMLVASNTSISTFENTVIQTGLLCATNYHITVRVTGGPRHEGSGSGYLLRFATVQVLVGGKNLKIYVHEILITCSKLMVVGYAIAQIYQPQLE